LRAVKNEWRLGEGEKVFHRLMGEMTILGCRFEDNGGQLELMEEAVMKRMGWLGGLLLVGVMLAIAWPSLFLPGDSSPVSSAPAPAPETRMEYQFYDLPQAAVHTLVISLERQPMERQPTLAIAPGLETVEQFAERLGAKAVLNGGFFDPQNQKTTSFVTLNGELVADPRQNERLMDNPDLVPYRDRILNRTELRRYRCGEGERYGLAQHRDEGMAGCALVDAIGGGPMLLPELRLEAEGFLDEATGRDPLGSGQKNARTAVGLMGEKMVWVMVGQKVEAAGGDSGTSSGRVAGGMSLPELAEFMKGLGVEQAMNLDGGSSSSLWFEGKGFYGKGDGGVGKRPVKSVLVVR
jgi:hypothetical protein